MQPCKFLTFVYLMLWLSTGCDSQKQTQAVNNSFQAIPTSPANDVQSTLESYLAECDSRLSGIEAKFSGNRRPVKLYSDGIDTQQTTPYAGVIQIRVCYKDGTGYKFAFFLKPMGGGWEYVRCYGGPIGGTQSEWTLVDLKYQFQGRIAVEWLLGEEKMTTILGI